MGMVIKRKPLLVDSINPVYEPVESHFASVPSPEKSSDGLPGHTLFKFQGSLRWYLLALTAYGVVALGASIFFLTCSTTTETAVRVLPMSSMPVNQFYSGLLLSSLLTPAAIMIRKVTTELALLHPFAIASKKPTEIEDLDLMLDPGIESMLRLFRYHTMTAIVQAILIVAGAILVPVGTLLIFPGTYSAPLQGIATVGMPILEHAVIPLWREMELAGGTSINETSQIDDMFLSLTTALFIGDVVRQSGVLNSVPTQLGPTATANLTYVESARYDSIVTFRWASGCNTTTAITYNESSQSDAWFFNVEIPGVQGIRNEDAYATCLVSSVVNEDDHGGTTYYAIMGTNQQTVNMEEALATGEIDTTGGAWISRVACKPTMEWEVSSCVWQNGSMTDCSPDPNGNTTTLDTEGLDAMYLYMTAIPKAIIDSGTYYLGLQSIQAALQYDYNQTALDYYRAPTISDYDKMYGLVAQSIASAVTSGYFGAAEVSTTGSAPQEAYLVRLYILAIVVAILVLCPLLPSLLIYRNIKQHTPIRRATFLTVASAVRGQNWDAALKGGCIMPDDELRKRYRGVRVMYGVDENIPHHVGFARDVSPVVRTDYYAGVSNEATKRPTFKSSED